MAYQYKKGWRKIGEQEALKNIINEEKNNPSEGSPLHPKFKQNSKIPTTINYPY